MKLWSMAVRSVRRLGRDLNDVFLATVGTEAGKEEPCATSDL